MGGRFQRRGAVIALAVVVGAILTGVPASAQQTKPKPGATQTPPAGPPVMIVPAPRQNDRTAPPVIVPDPPRPGPPPAPRNRSLITNPSWARLPVAEYPAMAIANGITAGRVTLRCVALPNGALSGCQVIEETPAGQGFASAALSAAARARLSPRTMDGADEGARVQFTTRFAAPVVVEPALRP